METLIVILIVGVGLLLVGKALCRTFAGKGGGCACGTASCSSGPARAPTAGTLPEEPQRTGDGASMNEDSDCAGKRAK